MATKTTEPRTLFDEEEEEVQLMPASQSVAMMTSRGESPLSTLAAMEHGLAIMKRRADILDQVRLAALRITDPRDWVQSKGKNDAQEDAVCLLAASGARKIAPYYGIEVFNVRPLDQSGSPAPIESKGEDGEVMYTLYFDLSVGLTKEVAYGLQASRSTSEQFIGRGGLESTSALVAKADITNAVYTLACTKGVRIGGAMKNVPVRELAAAWANTDKKIESIPRGSGFGTSSDRGAQSVTSEGMKEEQEKLRKEILARVGGDNSAARDLLKEITLWKGKDGKERWASSVTEIIKDYPMKLAWEKLREHETFGDKAAQGAGGAE